LEILTDGLGDSWRIIQCGMKAFPTEALTHAPISAVIDIIKANDLKPDQIAKVTIHTLARAADILSDPSKYDPRTRETADHSLPFVIAVAIADRQVTPASFTQEKIMDPKIRAQLKKVELIGDPEIDKVFPALQRTIVKIATTDGRLLTKQLEYPKGDPRNPLTDKEVEEKFASLADGVLSASAQEKLKGAIWNLDKVKSVKDFMALTKASLPKRKVSATRVHTKAKRRGRK
jgi:2-methylcitrate dehydratase